MRTVASSGAPGERLELEDAPDEPAAVESAGQRPAEELLRLLGGSRPDVGRADEPKRAPEHGLLPRAELREVEALERGFHGLHIRLLQREQPRDRVRRLGACRGLRELELELLLVPQVVHAEAEHARDGLGAEPGPRGQPGGRCFEPELASIGSKSCGADELGVELAERHRPGRVGHDRRRAADERERAVELVPGQGLVRPEVRDRRPHETGLDHGLDLRRGPRLRGSG